MARALTAPQQRMLAEIAATERGVLYVRQGGPYERTINALAVRGLVFRKEPDYSRLGMDGWALTDEGSDRAE